jgi:hypothetical protein
MLCIFYVKQGNECTASHVTSENWKVDGDTCKNYCATNEFDKCPRYRAIMEYNKALH